MNHVTIKHRHIPITLFKTGDLKQFKQIYENFLTYVNFDEFMKVYEYTVSQPHGFLFIDTDPSMRFRKNKYASYLGVKNGPRHLKEVWT